MHEKANTKGILKYYNNTDPVEWAERAVKKRRISRHTLLFRIHRIPVAK